MDSPVHSVTSKYRDLKLLGSGTYGQVYSAVNRETGKTVAIKKIVKSEHNKRVENEVRAGMKLRGIPNIANFIECYESRSSYWIIFEYIEGSDLFNFMEKHNFKAFSERDAKKMFRSVFAALEKMHAKGISHKDIKLENIMYNPNTKEVTFIDFGLCSFYSAGQTSRDFCGSMEYCAPEIRLKQTFSPEKVDVWSLGVTFFAILYGLFPFSPKDHETVRARGVFPQPQFPKAGVISPDAKDLLERMLQVDPDNRITIQEIASHPWVRKKRSFWAGFSSK